MSALHGVVMHVVHMHGVAMYVVHMHEAAMHEAAMHEAAMHEVVMHEAVMLSGRTPPWPGPASEVHASTRLCPGRS